MNANGADIVSPGDGTSKAIRSTETWQPRELLGAEVPLRFLCQNLLNVGSTPDTRLLPNKQTLLLYGRPGCGKNTLIHAVDNVTGRRIFLDKPAFAEIRDWKMRPWNGADFAEWARACVRRIQLIENDTETHHFRPARSNDGESERNPPVASGALLILIQDIHQLSYYRGNGEAATALMQLLTTARRCGVHRDRVRVLLTCSESPGQFPQEIQARKRNRFSFFHSFAQDLVDARCYVPLFDAKDRIAFMLNMMREFRMLCAKDTQLSKVSWVDIDLNDKAFLADPDHVLNTLAVYSTGTTPRELHDFMLRSFDACRFPNEDGSTEYSPELFNKLKYDVEGTFCITPYNPSSKNASLLTYAGMDPEVTAKNTRICVLNETGPDMSAALEKEPSNKRARVAAAAEGQPKNIHDAIADRVSQQEKLLKNAAKRDKAKADRERR
jgi:hypothetical protein